MGKASLTEIINYALIALNSPSLLNEYMWQVGHRLQFKEFPKAIKEPDQRVSKHPVQDLEKPWVKNQQQGGDSAYDKGTSDS